MGNIQFKDCCNIKSNNIENNIDSDDEGEEKYIKNNNIKMDSKLKIIIKQHQDHLYLFKK